MPTTVQVPNLGDVEFPDSMSEADIASTIATNLPTWRQSNFDPPPPPSFGEQAKQAAISTGKALVEPVRAIGQSMGYLGGITGALAKDVMSGNVLPSTQRQGLMPNLENVGAFMQGQRQPADQELTPVQQGIATGTRILPATALSGLGALVGIPPSVSFPILSGSETYAETGSPTAALTSAGIAAVVPGLQRAGMQGAARVTSNLVKRFAEATTGTAEQSVARDLINSQSAQKAIELAVGNAAAQSFLAATQLPEFLQATPEKKQEIIASNLTSGIGLSLLQLPYFSGKTLSETQKLISDDVPFMMNQMYSSPTTIDLLAREGFNPLKAQQFVETPPKQLTGGTYAPDLGQQQESRQQQYSGTGPIVQTEGIDRNIPPVEPAPGRAPSGGNLPIESGQVAPAETPTQPQVVGQVPISTQISGRDVSFGPTLEDTLAAQGITPASSPPAIEAAITQLKETVQKQLDAGVPVPPTLEAELGVVEKPVAPFKYHVLNTATGQYVPMFGSIPKTTASGIKGTTQGTREQVEAAGMTVPAEIPPLSATNSMPPFVPQENLISNKPIGGATAEPPIGARGVTEPLQAAAPAMAENDFQSPKPWFPPATREKIIAQVKKVFGDWKEISLADPSFSGELERLARQIGYRTSDSRFTSSRDFLHRVFTDTGLKERSTQETSQGRWLPADTNDAALIKSIVDIVKPPHETTAPTPAVETPTAQVKWEQHALYRWTPKSPEIARTWPEMEGYLWNDPSKSGVLGLVDNTGKTFPAVFVKDGVVTKIESAGDIGTKAHPLAIEEGRRVLVSGELSKAAQRLHDAFTQFKKSWDWQGNDPGSTYEQYKRSGASSKSSDEAVRLAVLEARKSGPSPEFRALFGGIDPSLVGSTRERVQDYAASLGIKYIPVTPAVAGGGALSGAMVPVPLGTKPVDSQYIIDQALRSGGGDAALRAVVPQLLIRYGPLGEGVPMDYENGVITINKPLLDMIAARWPYQSRHYITVLMSEELLHPVVEASSTQDQLRDVGATMDAGERAKLLALRPDIAGELMPSIQDWKLGHEYLRRLLQPELVGTTTEEAMPKEPKLPDPKTPFGQRVLATLKRVYDYLVNLVSRLRGQAGGPNPLAEAALARARSLLEALRKGGKLPAREPFDLGSDMGPLNAKAISDMIKSHAEMTAEEMTAKQEGKAIERPTAAQAMKLAQAGEVLAAHPVVRQAVQATQQAAAAPATTPKERHIRDVARGVLANPIVGQHLAEPVAVLDAAIQMADGDLATFEDVLRDPAATDDMKGAAAGNAKDTLMAYDEAAAHFQTKYATDREALMERLQKSAEHEFDAASARDVAGTLFKQFHELGQQIVNQTGDQAARSALKQAEDHSATSMKVLTFLSKTGILDGLTQDDNRSIADLMGYIYRHITENRAQFPKGTTPDSIVTENIGVGLDAIRDVLNIVRLSEPLRTAITESKDLAAGSHYKAPLEEIKNKVLDAISKGNLDVAHNLYEKGIVAQGITLKESRDVANFYARDTRKALVAVRALDGAKEIVDKLRADPALNRQRKAVYDYLNIREITHHVGATAIKFKSTVEGEPDTEITWEGTPKDYKANLQASRNLLGDYASYIAMADAGEPGYSPAKAAGLKQSAKELEDFTDPARDPRRGTLMPGIPAKFTEYLGSFVGHPELVPKYLLPRLAGPMGDMVNKTAVAFSDVKERPANLATNLAGRRRLLQRAALDSHGGMRPWQYRKLVFNPTVASMQNFSDPGQLRAGDPIGNGQHVTKEDLAYIDHIRAFQNEVFATINNYAKHRFAALSHGFTGILFDKNGMVRFPYARGPRTLSRRFPPDLVSTIGPGWRAATTPESKARFIDSHLTDVLLSYVRGVNASDFERPYPEKYRLAFKQIIREFGDKPLTTFDDFVDRVTTIVNRDPDATPVTQEDVRKDLLGEINGFIEAGMKVAEDAAKTDQSNPKVHITVVGGNNEMNSPREQAILPPGMYDYGIVDENELASFLRDSAISHGNLHLEAVNAWNTEATRKIQEYKNEARNRNVPISTIYKESHEAMLKSQERYSLAALESLKEVLDAYAVQTENEIRDSANPWMKERPHQVVTNPVMRALITSLVTPLKPFFRNFVGGGEQIVILNKIMRNLSWPHALASGGKQMINGAIKELIYLSAKATHPGAKQWRDFLEDPRGRAAVSGIAKAFMDVVHERQDLRDLQAELGTTTTANVRERLRGQWAFASTGGKVSYDEPGRARRVVNRLATMLNMYSEALGSGTFLGYADSRLNGVGPYITQKIVKDMKSVALAYGDKLTPDGLYPDEALASGAGGWGSENQAAQLRQMWRTNGWGVLDRMLSEYYNKVMAARAQEAQQGLPKGTLEDKVDLLTPEQTNQMYVGIPEDTNMPTRQSRPRFFASNPVLRPFGWLLQWGTAWLQKLLSLTQVLNNQPFLKRHGAILPLMASVGILLAIMATVQTEVSSRVIGRMLENKVTNFPTLFDATTPGQAASAVLAATADTIPIYGDALNMLTGTGFKRGFDINSTFLLMNLASDVMKTSKEIYQSGAIGRPMLQFASRYTYPFNQLAARFPSVSGLRDLTNARNILTMGAKGTGLETKLRKQGSGGVSDITYTASTPLINDAVNAIGNDDQEGFQRAMNALTEQKRAAGSLNPRSAAATAIKARNPIVSVFGTRPTNDELERAFSNLPADLAERARSTIARFDSALASISPKTGTKRTATTGRVKPLSMVRGLRKPRLRLVRPRISLRRLAA